MIKLSYFVALVFSAGCFATSTLADDHAGFQTMSDRSFLAPPGFFADARAHHATTSSDLNRAVEQKLTTYGIEFPLGAKAELLPGSNKFIVHDTPDQLDRIVALIERVSHLHP